jgi:hypothetical protein
MGDHGSNSLWRRNAVLLSLALILCAVFAPLARAQTTISATSVSFGNVVVNEASAVRAVTLRNTQGIPLQIISLVVPRGGYALDASTTCPNPGSIAAGARCAIALTLTPSALGPVPAGSLTINTNASDSPRTVALSGVGIAPTTLSATSVNFGNVVVYEPSVVRGVTLKNNQRFALNIGSLVLSSSGFALDPSTTCPNPGALAASSSCTIAVTLTPTAMGAASGTLTINSDAPTSPQSIGLSGNGIAPTTLTPVSLGFGNVLVNKTSSVRTATLTNRQRIALNVFSIVVPAGGFAIDPSTTCPNPGSLAASTSCTIAVTLTPTAPNPVSGQLTLTTDASNSPQTVSLSGTGIPLTTLSATSLSFGNVVINEKSAIQGFTLTNNQTTSLNIASLAVPTAGFAIDPSTTCPNPGSLAAAAKCRIALTLTPTVLGSVSGSLVINTDAANSPQSVSVSGTGIPPTTLSATSLDFGSVMVNQKSAIRSVTFTNNQLLAMRLNSLVIAGSGFTLDPSTTCPHPGSLARLASCAIALIFTPNGLGLASGALTINTNASNSPQSVTLSGVGIGAGLQITTTSLSNGQVGVAYGQTVTATGGTTPYAWSISAGSLPAGLMLNATTGAISGTPTTAGVSNFTVQVTDSETTPVSKTAPLSITTTPAALSITTSTLPNGSQGVAYSQNLGATGGTPPYTWAITVGSLPTGLALHGDTGAISGTPTATGASNFTVLVTDAGSHTATANLFITVGTVVLSPSSLQFPAQLEGTTSGAQSVNIQNQQGVTLHLAGVTIGGANSADFAVVNPCTTIAAGSSCAVSVTFTPSGSGTRTAALSVADDAPNSPQTVLLSGAGNAPVSVAPLSITNFTADVGTTSAFQTITITNNNPSASLSITRFEIDGDFVQTMNACKPLPAIVAAGGSCSLNLSFSPTMGGTRTGRLLVYDDAFTSPQVVNLSGTATNPLTISTAALTFSAQKLGSQSPGKWVLLANHESQVENFSVVMNGDFSYLTNCSTGVIPANSSCILSVFFNPPSTETPGPVSGSMTVTDTAPNVPGALPLLVSLTGSATSSNPPPAVLNVSPGAGQEGAQVNVVITGNAWTHFSTQSVITFTDTDNPSYPADITVVSQSTSDAQHLTATVQLASGPDTVFGARDITVTTPLSGGVTETAYLYQAFILADPTNSHAITNISPVTIPQCGTGIVTVDASGTNFMNGTTIANFGDGVNVNWVQVNGATNVTVNISVPCWAFAGGRTITLATGGEFAVSQTGAFQVTGDGATIGSLTPNAEAQGWAGQLTLVGVGTHFAPDGTQVIIGGGVVVGAVDVQDPTHAMVQVAVPANAVPGLQSMTVSTGGEIESLSNAFTVMSATELLTGVSPSSGYQGQTLDVTITGNQFTNFVQDQVQVNFGDSVVQGWVPTTGFVMVNGTPTVIDPHTVKVNITIAPYAGLGTLNAYLTSGPSGAAMVLPFAFTVTQSNAQIVSLTPVNVPQGGQVTLTLLGSNTHWNQAQTTAGPLPLCLSAVPIVNEINVQDATQAQMNITVTTDTLVGNYRFYMATGGEIVVLPDGSCVFAAGEVETSSINVYAHTPAMTMNPSNGLVLNAGNDTFTVNFAGQFTHWNPSDTVITIDGEGVTLAPVQSATPPATSIVTGLTTAVATLTITPGAAAGPRKIIFTTGNEIVSTYFNVTQTPVGILSVSPSHAAQSKSVSVQIVGLNTHWKANISSLQVLFGPQISSDSSTLNVADDTHLSLNIATSYLVGGASTPTPPGAYTVYVNDVQEQVIGSFTVDPPATATVVNVCIIGQSPCVSSAQQGSTYTVTITGQGTNWTNQTEAILGEGIDVSFPPQNVTPPTTVVLPDGTVTTQQTYTAVIAVSPTAPIGDNGVVMITASEVDTGSGFSVTPSAAGIQAIQPQFTCSDANSVTATNPNGGTSSASNCNQNFGILVVAQLQTATLHITATGTHWLQGKTIASLGNGIHIDNLTITSPTTANIQFTVLSTCPLGLTALTMITDGEVVTLQDAIDVEAGVAKLLAFSPAGAPQGDTLTLQVLGRFTHWDNTTVVNFSSDVTVNSVNVIDSETMTANITLSPWANVDYWAPCGHSFTVTTGTEQVSTDPNVTGNLCVSLGVEQITSVSPLAGIQGSTEVLTINGSGTNFVAGVTTVSFGDPNFQAGQVTVTSPTSLTVPVGISTAATTGFKLVTVQTYGQVASKQFSFTVTAGVGVLTEANPYQAPQGAQHQDVILTGQYTHFSSASTATFGAGIVVNSVTLTSPTQITANISIDPISCTGVRTVTVTTPGVLCTEIANDANTNCPANPTTETGSEIVAANVFTVIQGPATISTVAPNTGNQGQEVIFTLNGSATHWQQNFTQFYMQGVGSDITVNSVVFNNGTSATADVTISPTAQPGPRSIYMLTAGESLADAGAFVVTGGVPAIANLSPNSAQQGRNQLRVTINGIYTKWDSTTTVNFGPGITVTSFQVDDNTHLEALINIDPNAQIGYRTVVAQTGTQMLSSSFQVTAPGPPPTPYINYFWPNSGLTGQTLTISFSGMYTHWDPGPVNPETQVTFGDGITMNWGQVLSPASYAANITIAPDATPGQRLFVFSTGADPATAETESVTFNVVSSTPNTADSVTPTLSIVDPGSGMQGTRNLVVNIIGQYTAFDDTTAFTFGNGIQVNGAPVILGPTIATQTITLPQMLAAGVYAVTAITPDASLISQQMVSGATFTVTPSLAAIQSVIVNTTKQGDTVTVAVTGVNTHWDGTTTFAMGSGITVLDPMIIDATHATITLSIPPLAPLGATWITAQTAGEAATMNNAFVVQAGTPLLLSSGPGSLPQQSSATFTVLSQATNWTPATPPTVSYGPGVLVSNVNVTSPTSMTVTGAIDPLAYVGYRSLTVTSGLQVLGLSNVLYVSPGPAVIDSVTPNTAGQGADVNVTITGINTHWAQGVTSFNFPNVLVKTMDVVDQTHIQAEIVVSDYAPTGQVSISTTTLGENASGPNVFLVTQTQPELLAVVNASDAQGATDNITLTGAFTHFDTATSVVTLGPGITVNSIQATASNKIVASITVSPTATIGYRNVTVTTSYAGGTEAVSLNNGFQVTPGPAAISNLNPPTGAQNSSQTVLVTGSQTHFCYPAGATCQTPTLASFGGGISVSGITVLDALHAKVNISIPASTAAGQYDVTLTTGGETATILGGFSVSAGAPVLSIVSPPTGHQGDTHLSVSLSGLYTNFINGTSTATFGAGITVNWLRVTSATSATADITISQTATIGSRTVTVTTGTEVATLIGGFSVLAGVPALLPLNPSMGTAGSSGNTIITGAFTTFQQAFSNVNMGSGITVNFINVTSTTQLTVNFTIAANASVGPRDVSVTTNGQTLVLSNGFTVLPGTPAVTQLNPNIGNPGQSLPVTITGQYTNWLNGTTTVSFGGGITVNSIVVSSTTSLTVNITIPSDAVLGPQDLTVTTFSEVETVPGGFTIQAPGIPAPYVISVSPPPSAEGIPINSSFYIVFSQPMDRSTLNTSNVSFQLVSNPNGVIQVPINISVDATGRILTFNTSGLLAVNSTYNIYLSNNIKDAAGTQFSGYGNYGYYYSNYFYTKFTANTTPAAVIAANPPANSTGIGTNVPIQLEFSATMNQSTQAGMVVTADGNTVAGTYSWNASAYCCSWGPGTILTFTPSAPLQPNTVYTVSYSDALADTAGNTVTAGSFSFATGAGPDTAYNSSSPDFAQYTTNVGLNFAPKVNFSKPVDPIDINTGTLILYNADSGKYLPGTVTVAPNGMSATFKPQYPLLPDTYYSLYQAGGYYDADGNYLYGMSGYFTTGTTSDVDTPSVASVSPSDGATSVPLNAEVIIHFAEAVDADSINNNTVTIMPAGGGSIVTGTASLAGDLVTLAFTPSTAGAGLQPGTQYSVQVSGFYDLEGNSGATFTSTFTTADSLPVISVSTGIDATGALITTLGALDPHWTYVATASTPYGVFSASGPPQPLQVSVPGTAGGYGGWPANGPNSSWITINANHVSYNSYGVYSTTFTLPNPLPAYHLCVTGKMGVDDGGVLGINGTAIMGYLGQYNPLAPISIDITNYAQPGMNTLALAWGSADDYYEGFRLEGVVAKCGASLVNALSLTSATPSSGASNVPVDTNITLTFNNPLDPATVNSTTLPIMVGWNSNQEIAGTYTVTGNQVVFTPASPFPVNAQIWVGACNGPLDLAGDTAGYCYTQLAYFTTGGTVVPAGSPFRIVAFTPANNAQSVGLRAPVAATFNRSVNMNSVNANDFALFAGGGPSPFCTSMSHSQDDTTIAFNCYPLPASATMTAFLGSGLSDWQGNPLSNFRSQFTTAGWDSSLYGSLTSSRPGNGASGVDPNAPLTLFFNMPIDSGTAANGIQVAQNNQAMPGNIQVLDNGYVLTFTPSTPFAAGALIQWWTTGTLIESTYNTPIYSASGYYYVAGSTDTLVPAIQSTSPMQYSAGVPLNSIFEIQFNTPLDPATVNSNSIFLYDSHTGLNVDAALTMPQPNEVRLVPSAPLSANSYIYLYTTSGLQSATSVPASASSYYIYTATTADNTMPVVVSAVPYNGSANIGINASPGVVFNKSIDPVSVNSSTFQVTQGANPIPGTFWFSSNDTRVQFVPNAALPASSAITMKLNGVLDVVGNPINYTSIFQTGTGPDYSNPSVVSTSVPASGSVPTNTSITVQFSEPMDVTNFSVGSAGNCGNIYIADTVGSWTCIGATLNWSADQSTANITPNAPLAAGRTYYMSLGGGTDLAGNGLNGFSQYFSAEFGSASTGPSVVYFNPLPNATGLGTNAIIEVQFSAPIDPTTLANVKLTSGGTTITTSPSVSAGNTVIQLVPAKPLAANTVYVMTVAGVKDPAGNPVTTATSTFTTGATYDIMAPNEITSDPAYNNTVGTNVTPKLVFNEPLNPITVNNSTFRMYLNDTNQWIPLAVTPSSDGLTVNMVPQIAIQPNTRYYIYACCGFQDQNGNNGNVGPIYFWTSSGAVTSRPTVVVTPADGASGVPRNTQVFASVSAALDPASVGQNAIQLFDPLNNPVAGTVTLVTAQQINFAPTAPLIAATTYTVKVDHFTDENGNAVVPYTGTFITGTANITTGLSVTSSDPPWGASGVSQNQVITLTFSQNLVPATLSALMVMNGNSNYPLPGTWAMSAPNQAQFTPSSPYPAGAQVWVESCNGPTDILGEIYNNGGCWSQILYFNVGSGIVDNTPLQVLSVNPPQGSTNVRPDTTVSVTFNKGINFYSVYNNTNNALLFAGQGVQDRGSITMSSDGRTMSFSSGTLISNTTYTIYLPAGGISDNAGNTLAATYSSTFTTGSNPLAGNGSVVGTSPGANASGVPAGSLLTLYVNRQVDSSTLPGNLTVTVNGQVYAGTVQAIADEYEVQYTPATPFPAGATVQWFFSNVYDVFGNTILNSSNVFYTAPAVNPTTTQPTIVAISPSGGTVPTNTQIDIQYSQPIDGTTLSGNIYLYSWGTGQYLYDTGRAFTLTLPSPNIVRITMVSLLTPSTSYGVCINGNVKGENGLLVPTSCWATTFYTGTGPDSAAGTISVGPPNGVINVGTNAYIRLQFSKPADITSVNSTNVQIAVQGNPIPGYWSYNYNYGPMGANFTPLNPLPASSVISISATNILDYAGNVFTPVDTQFITAALPDYNAPSVSLDFGQYQNVVATNASFTCRYSKPMDPSSIYDGNTYLFGYVEARHIPVAYQWSSDLMVLTLTPTSQLFEFSQYDYVCSGGIDLTGNGQYPGSTYFYTGAGPSSAGPVLIAANPPNGMTDVPLNNSGGPWGTALMLGFSQPVSTNSLGAIALTPQGGSPIPIIASTWNGGASTIVVVQLPWALAANTTFTYNVAGVKDMNGNLVTGKTTSSFTTGSSFDWTNPWIVSTVPANSATAPVNTPISVTFSEAINPVLITFGEFGLHYHNTGITVGTTIGFSSDYKTVTLTPNAPLDPSTIYDLYYYPNNWYLYDVAGNADYSSGLLATFTTGTAEASNGMCGPANGMTFAFPPSTNLCSAGTVSGQSNNGTYSWTCSGSNGGADASCSATIVPGSACYAQSSFTPSTLAGWWKGDDSTADQSGNGNNGTLENGARYMLGFDNDAFLLNGNNQFVLVGSPVPNNLQIQSAITLQAWIYVSGYPLDYGYGALGFIAGSQRDASVSGASIFFDGRTNPDGVTGSPPGHIALNIGGDGSWHLTHAQTQVPLNQWVLVTATRSANGVGKIYYNGVLQPSLDAYQTTWNGDISYDSTWFGIGQQNDMNRPFSGLLDEVQVFNGELSAGQIQGIYLAGNAGICP